MLPPDSYEFHTKCRSTPGCASHGHWPDPHTPFVAALVFRILKRYKRVYYLTGWVQTTLTPTIQKEQEMPHGCSAD